MPQEVVVYGASWCPDTRRCKRLLGEARIDYEWADIDQEPGAANFVRRCSGGKLVIPVIVIGDGPALMAPATAELAARLGLDPPTARRFFDLVVVGAGPAGLTAALYALREGIHCVVIERGSPGGQAAMTPHLHGCPGFPEGVSGTEVEETLVEQAQRYGVRMVPAALRELRRIDGYLLAVTDDGEEFAASSILIATGVEHGRLGVPGEEELRGAGVHFCASCDGPFYRKTEELLVVGGGDLAVQEALFLTQFAQKVRVLESTSDLTAAPLLQEKLRRHPRVELYTSTEIVELSVGEDGKLAAAVVRDRTTGYTFAFNPSAVFVYAGMTPNTEPLKGMADLDDAGFVLTDRALQSSIPGVFAAGDVRAGSTKRLASAIGEGAAAVTMVRQHLERLGDLAVRPSA
jgi:thioredoxin reductase (NADPH)